MISTKLGGALLDICKTTLGRRIKFSASLFTIHVIFVCCRLKVRLSEEAKEIRPTN